MEKKIETYLLENQQPDGSFLSLSSPHQDFSQKPYIFKTIFSNAIILQILTTLPSSPELEIIKRNLFSFLKKQKSENETYNYWDRESREFVAIPYPEDLDDTFCALSALYQYDQKMFSGKSLRNITEILITQEAQSGGPYYTWITNKENIEWLDIDIAVNNNIAYFLSHLDIQLDGITNYVETSIKESRLVSRYYPSNIPVYYFISRWYDGIHKKKIVENLLKEMRKPGKSFLDEILAGIVLLKYSGSHDFCDRLFVKIEKNFNGIFKPYTFYRGVNPTGDGTKYFAGSSALTATFALEFLHLYKQKHSELEKPANKKRNILIKFHKKVIIQTHEYLVDAGGDIKKYGLRRLSLLASDPIIHHITMLPTIVDMSIQNSQDIDEKILISLGTGTLLGWLAYDIYDDFFDNEGKSEELAAANYALRILSDIFTHLDLNGEFTSFFHKTLNIVDNANARETNMTTYPDKNVFEKSIAHMTAAVAVFALHGYPPSHRSTKKLVRFFIHYLSARQINDDMHDWEDDLTRGRINFVSAHILPKATLKSLQALPISQLQTIFWHKTAEKICDIMQKHIDEARKNISTLDAIKVKSPFLSLLTSLEENVATTRRERTQALEFISS